MSKVVTIEGMTCHNCVRHVKEAIEELEGVTGVEVDLASKRATVDGEASDEAIKAAVDEAGYSVTGVS